MSPPFDSFALPQTTYGETPEERRERIRQERLTAYNQRMSVQRPPPTAAPAGGQAFTQLAPDPETGPPLVPATTVRPQPYAPPAPDKPEVSFATGPTPAYPGVTAPVAPSLGLSRDRPLKQPRDLPDDQRAAIEASVGRYEEEFGHTGFLAADEGPRIPEAPRGIPDEPLSEMGYFEREGRALLSRGADIAAGFTQVLSDATQAASAGIGENMAGNAMQGMSDFFQSSTTWLDDVQADDYQMQYEDLGHGLEQAKQGHFGYLLGFIAEQAPITLADAMTSLAGMPLYLTATTGDFAAERAQNDGRGRDELTAEDYAYGSAAATVSFILDKILLGQGGKVAEKMLGQEAVKQLAEFGSSSTMKRVLTSGFRGAASESMEESAQQALTTVDTEKGATAEDIALAGLGGALAGGPAAATFDVFAGHPSTRGIPEQEPGQDVAADAKAAIEAQAASAKPAAPAFAEGAEPGGPITHEGIPGPPGYAEGQQPTPRGPFTEGIPGGLPPAPPLETQQPPGPPPPDMLPATPAGIAAPPPPPAPTEPFQPTGEAEALPPNVPPGATTAEALAATGQDKGEVGREGESVETPVSEKPKAIEESYRPERPTKEPGETEDSYRRRLASWQHENEQYQRDLEQQQRVKAASKKLDEDDRKDLEQPHRILSTAGYQYLQRMTEQRRAIEEAQPTREEGETNDRYKLRLLEWKQKHRSERDELALMYSNLSEAARITADNLHAHMDDADKSGVLTAAEQQYLRGVATNLTKNAVLMANARGNVMDFSIAGDKRPGTTKTGETAFNRAFTSFKKLDPWLMKSLNLDPDMLRQAALAEDPDALSDIVHQIRQAANTRIQQYEARQEKAGKAKEEGAERATLPSLPKQGKKQHVAKHLTKAQSEDLRAAARSRSPSKVQVAVQKILSSVAIEAEPEEETEDKEPKQKPGEDLVSYRKRLVTWRKKTRTGWRKRGGKPKPAPKPPAPKPVSRDEVLAEINEILTEMRDLPPEGARVPKSGEVAKAEHMRLDLRPVIRDRYLGNWVANPNFGKPIKLTEEEKAERKELQADEARHKGMTSFYDSEKVTVAKGPQGRVNIEKLSRRAEEAEAESIQAYKTYAAAQAAYNEAWAAFTEAREGNSLDALQDATDALSKAWGVRQQAGQEWIKANDAAREASIALDARHPRAAADVAAELASQVKQGQATVAALEVLFVDAGGELRQPTATRMYTGEIYEEPASYYPAPEVIQKTARRQAIDAADAIATADKATRAKIATVRAAMERLRKRKIAPKLKANRLAVLEQTVTRLNQEAEQQVRNAMAKLARIKAETPGRVRLAEIWADLNAARKQLASTLLAAVKARQEANRLAGKPEWMVFRERSHAQTEKIIKSLREGNRIPHELGDLMEVPGRHYEPVTMMKRGLNEKAEKVFKEVVLSPTKVTLGKPFAVTESERARYGAADEKITKEQARYDALEADRAVTETEQVDLLADEIRNMPAPVRDHAASEREELKAFIRLGGADMTEQQLDEAAAEMQYRMDKKRAEDELDADERKEAKQKLKSPAELEQEKIKAAEKKAKKDAKAASPAQQKILAARDILNEFHRDVDAEARPGDYNRLLTLGRRIWDTRFDKRWIPRFHWVYNFVPDPTRPAGGTLDPKEPYIKMYSSMPRLDTQALKGQGIQQRVKGAKETWRKRPITVYYAEQLESAVGWKFGRTDVPVYDSSPHRSSTEVFEIWPKKYAVYSTEKVDGLVSEIMQQIGVDPATARIIASIVIYRASKLQQTNRSGSRDAKYNEAKRKTRRELKGKGKARMQQQPRRAPGFQIGDKVEALNKDGNWVQATVTKRIGLAAIAIEKAGFKYRVKDESGEEFWAKEVRASEQQPLPTGKPDETPAVETPPATGLTPEQLQAIQDAIEAGAFDKISPANRDHVENWITATQQAIEEHKQSLASVEAMMPKVEEEISIRTPDASGFMDYPAPDGWPLKLYRYWRVKEQDGNIVSAFLFQLEPFKGTSDASYHRALLGYVNFSVSEYRTELAELEEKLKNGLEAWQKAGGGKGGGGRPPSGPIIRVPPTSGGVPGYVDTGVFAPSGDTSRATVDFVGGVGHEPYPADVLITQFESFGDKGSVGGEPALTNKRPIDTDQKDTAGRAYDTYKGRMQLKARGGAWINAVNRSGFLGANGTGSGKSLVMAMLGHAISHGQPQDNSKRVLYVHQNGQPNAVRNAIDSLWHYGMDSKDEGRWKFIPYAQLEETVATGEEFAAVLFDEAHWIMAPSVTEGEETTATAKTYAPAAAVIKTDFRAFFSATPTDGPLQEEYYLRYLHQQTDRPLTIEEGEFAVRDELGTHGGKTPSDFMKKLERDPRKLVAYIRGLVKLINDAVRNNALTSFSLVPRLEGKVTDIREDQIHPGVATALKTPQEHGSMDMRLNEHVKVEAMVERTLDLVEAARAKGDKPAVINVFEHSSRTQPRKVKGSPQRLPAYKMQGVTGGLDLDQPAIIRMRDLLKQRAEERKIQLRVGFMTGGEGRQRKGGKYQKSVDIADDFQNDEFDVLLMTDTAGGTGINLDDTIGDRPRYMLISGAKSAGLSWIQLMGRTDRKSTVSTPYVEWMKPPNSDDPNHPDKQRRESIKRRVNIQRAAVGMTGAMERGDIDASKMLDKQPTFRKLVAGATPLHSAPVDSMVSERLSQRPQPAAAIVDAIAQNQTDPALAELAQVLVGHPALEGITTRSLSDDVGYHGTREKFTQFEERAGTGVGMFPDSWGTFFADSPNMARLFASMQEPAPFDWGNELPSYRGARSRNLKKVRLQLTNPIVLDFGGENYDTREVLDRVRGRLNAEKPFSRHEDPFDPAGMRKILLSRGYDGVIVKNARITPEAYSKKDRTYAGRLPETYTTTIALSAEKLNNPTQGYAAPGLIAVQSGGEAAVTFLHEAIHQITHRVINDPSPKGVTLRARLLAIMKALPPEVVSDIEGVLTDPHEFVAEAFSNPRFQEILKTAKTPSGATLWQRFIEWVQRVIGASSRPLTAFAAVMELRSELLDPGTVTEHGSGDVSQQLATTMYRQKRLVPAAAVNAANYLADKGDPAFQAMLSTLTWDQIADTYGHLSVDPTNEKKPGVNHLQEIRSIMAARYAYANKDRENYDRKVLRPLYEWAADPKGGRREITVKLTPEGKPEKMPALQYLFTVMNDTGIGEFHLGKDIDDKLNAALKPSKYTEARQVKQKDGSYRTILPKGRNRSHIIWELHKPQFDKDGSHGLGESGRKLYNDMAQFFRDQSDQVETMVAVQYLELVDPRKDGQKWHSVTPKEVRDRITQLGGMNDADLAAKGIQRKGLGMVRTILDPGRVPGVYFPITRHGEWVVSARETIPYSGAADKEEKLRRYFGAMDDPQKQELTYYSVTRFENKSDGEAWRERMKAALPQAKVSQVMLGSDTAVKEETKISESLLSALVERINAQEGISAGDKQAQINLLTQSMIDLLPESSFADTFRPRKGVLGMSQDIFRGLNAYGSGLSHYKAAAVFATQHRDALRNFQGLLYQLEHGDAEQGARARKLRRISNELGQRSLTLSTPFTERQWAQTLNNVGFAYMLVGASYNVLNMSQPVLFTVPYLAGDHGLAATTGAMTRAYRLVGGGPLYRLAKTGFSITALKGLIPGRREDFNRKNYDVLTEMKEQLRAGGDERHARLLEHLSGLGILDATVAMDMGAEAKTSHIDAGGNLKKQGVLSYLSEWMKMAPHITEVMNRAVTGVAAYDLEYVRLMRQGKVGAAEASRQATEYAAKTINQTQFNLQIWNKPRIIQGSNVARTLLMFKQHPQHVYYFMISRAIKSSRALTKKAMGKKLTEDEAKEAKVAFKQLAYFIGMHALAAGAIGATPEPIKWVIGLLSTLFGDDDEPFNFELWMQQSMSDWLGPEWGNVVARGAPNLMGVDASSRIGINNLLMFDTPSMENPDAFMSDVFRLVGGPMASLAERTFYIAPMALANGEYTKAIEAVTPKILRDPIRAYRVAGEGYTTYNGRVYSEPNQIGPLELFFTSMGFSPSSTSLMYMSREVENTYEIMQGKRANLMRTAYFARDSRQSWNAALAEIKRWNQDNRAFQISMADLVKSMKGRARSQRNTHGGILVPERYQPWAVEQNRFRDLPPITQGVMMQ